MNKKYLYLGFALVAVVYFVSSQKWKGYVCPDKNNLSNVIELEISKPKMNVMLKLSILFSGSVVQVVTIVLLTKYRKGSNFFGA
jgi:hypothetical protein